MTRNEAVSRISSVTSSSTDSGRSTATVKPLPLTPTSASAASSTSAAGNSSSTPVYDTRSSSATKHSAFASSRRGPPSRLKTDEHGHMIQAPIAREESQISPTSAAHRDITNTSSSSPSVSAGASASPQSYHPPNAFGNYRRDLAVLDSSGKKGAGAAGTGNGMANRGTIAPQIPQITPVGSAGFSQVAPWMTGDGAGSGLTNVYGESTENGAVASQMPPGLRTSMTARSVQTPTTNESSEPAGFNDDRRPSVASVATTASSQTSRTSDRRQVGLRKLQGIFGDDSLARDASEAGLATGKEHRSMSYSQARNYRERNPSNATDQTRDASPSSSRPRTPVPSSDVVPFLYQEADDIVKFGEAPVRNMLSGPDRERYASDAGSQAPPKTSSSSRSSHSIALPHHRYNKSTEEGHRLRQSISRDESVVSLRERTAPGSYASSRRAQSPTPSVQSNLSILPTKNGGADSQASPGGHHHHRRGLFGRLRRHKDRDDPGVRPGQITSSQTIPAAPAKKFSISTHSLSHRPSRQEFGSPSDEISPFASEIPSRARTDYEKTASLYSPASSRQAPFNNKFPFSKRNRTNRNTDDHDEMIGPTDRPNDGTQFFLDTNLDNMEGILSKPGPQAPMEDEGLKNGDAGQAGSRVDHYKTKNASGAAAAAAAAAVAASPSTPGAGPSMGGPNGAWNAPDSWAVRRTEELAALAAEADEESSSPLPEEKGASYCIRVFKSDGTFATLQMPLNSSVQDVIAQLSKRVFTESLNYQIVLRVHDLIRILSPPERPLQIQKRMLKQVGYEDRDHLGDLGREDNSYLCRFLFLSARESDFHSKTHDLGLSRMPKVNHIDLSGRNLITIPISLYSKAGDIISLNLSRNLSLNVPRDFIQSCLNLRDIKYSNNESRRIPPSLGRASRLTFLDISNNRVDTLEHAELEEITGILKLNLANNRLKHLPSYFGSYKSLRSLNISSNFLDKFPSFLTDIESLIDLDMSFNLISSLPESIGKLKNLDKLAITNNRLSGALPSTFRDLQSLRELDIKYNGITSIDVISELPKLEILTADHNSISQFVGGFDRLRTLKLNANPITRFEITSALPTLKLLNLSNAQLASIADSFDNMRNLEQLHLDKNYFVSLPNQIGNLSRLEKFSIANNSVGELPVEIGCLMELRMLDVHGNNIRKLPMEIWWANKLETLNASSNVLDNFPKPASRPPQLPGDTKEAMSTNSSMRMNSTVGTLSSTPSSEELISIDGSRRPSQASSTLLSVGPSPVPAGADRKGSVVSVYGIGGRKTSVVSRSTMPSSGMATPTPATTRKDSGLSSRITNTFAGSLRNLYLADNQLDDDVFDQLALLGELRVLNLSYNDLTDMPQRSMMSWPQLVELYLSSNELTTLPADDLGEYSMLQVLHINGNKFTNLPADISRAKKLAVFDCGNNSLKYNISNVPYDWNWNLNPNLRYLNLSGNRRLEIKQTTYGAGAAARSTEKYTDFNRLVKLRVLGLMDVTLTQPSIPDQNEDRRVRTSGSMAGFLPYGMADTLGKNEHMSTVDLVVPRFTSSSNDSGEQDMLLGLFDGQALSSGGSKIAKFLHENFGRVFSAELKALKTKDGEATQDALRRAFLNLNKDLVTSSIQADDRMPKSANGGQIAHRGSIAPMVLTKEDLNSGGVATVAYLQGQELFVANIGDAQAMLIVSDGTHKMLTHKHDPAEPSERSRIRDAGGWVSRNGRLNDTLDVSRAFGYSDLMPAVMAAPYITSRTICDQDETVLIATKELWEYVSPGLVVDIARQERGDLMRASQKLRDLAMAYGASGKIMVMMLSVSDLKRKTERSRLHRGQSMSLYPSGFFEDSQQAPTRRGKRTKGDVLDSTLQRLEAEVPAPTGLIAIVFTDIKSSTNLWETYPAAMRSAIKLHNEVMRRQLRQIGGFEVKTEGDAFMVSFPTATSALLWAFQVQLLLLDVQWPTDMLNAQPCQLIMDKDNNVVFRGLSVRMGIHWGEPLCETDPITRRMDYYGPMVNKASRISSEADGGQITVSSDFISEIKRCMETYQESSPGNSIGTDDAPGGPNAPEFDEDDFATAIRKELRALMSQGFSVKEMGEVKLKGLENPELVYSLYPQALAGRTEVHQQHGRAAAAAAAAANGEAVAAEVSKALPQTEAGTSSPAAAISMADTAPEDLKVVPEVVWSLWRVSLRLEMLCSALEAPSGNGLRPAETDLLDNMRSRGTNVTESFMVNFMEHQVSRIETCITTLSLRHMAMGGGEIRKLDDLRASMTDIFSALQTQMAELQRYKARYGDIQEIEEEEDDDEEYDEDDEGSDTEQER